MRYDINENNHSYCLNKGPRYNTDRCSKLHGTMFYYFIRNDRTEGCNIMCSMTAHNKLQYKYVDG